MHLFVTLGLLLSTSPSIIAALGIDGDDIPAACAAVCEPLVQLSLACDQDDDVVGERQEEALETDCICGNTDINVVGVTADCAVCVGENVVDRDNIEGLCFPHPALRMSLLLTLLV